MDIQVKANQRCDKLSLSLYITDEKNHDVFNVSTERLGWPSFSLNAGETKLITLRLQLHLARGTFTIGTHVYRYDIQKMYDDQMPLGTLFVTSDMDVRGVANLYPHVESARTVV